MILDRKSVPLNAQSVQTPSLTRILHLFPTINQTFLLLCKPSHNRHVIMHLSSKGQQLYKHYFPYEQYRDIPIQRMGMIYQNTAILIVPKKDQVLIFSVWKKQFKENQPIQTKSTNDSKMENGQHVKKQRNNQVKQNEEQNTSQNIKGSQTSQSVPKFMTEQVKRNKFSYGLSHHPHHFMNEISNLHTIYFFPMSQMFSIIEQGHYNDNRMRLTYYLYPAQESLKQVPLLQPYKYMKQLPLMELQKITFLEITDAKEWNFDCVISQANRQSMIIWYNPKQGSSFQFTTFSCKTFIPSDYHQAKTESSQYTHQSKKNQRQTFQWIKKRVQIPHKISHLDSMNIRPIQINIKSIFQFTPSVFIAFCITNRKLPHQSNSYPQSCNKINFGHNQHYTEYENKMMINNNFLIDTINQTVRQTKFKFGVYQQNLIEEINLGNFTVIKTFMAKKGKTQLSPVFYINNQTQKICCIEPWYCLSNVKWELPGYEIDTIQECNYSNGDKINFFSKVITKSVHQPKFLYLHMLLQIYDNFDDDLLQDTIELIDYDVQNQLRFDV